MSTQSEADGFKLFRSPSRQISNVLNLYLIDCSYSMLQSGALSIGKGILLAMIDQAYRNRQRVAIIEFGGHAARITVKPQRGNWKNAQWIDPIAGGGGTPLANAVNQANELIKQHLDDDIHFFLMTDGLVPHIPSPPKKAAHIIVIDLETGPVHSRMKQAVEISKQWNATHLAIF